MRKSTQTQEQEHKQEQEVHTMNTVSNSSAMNNIKTFHAASMKTDCRIRSNSKNQHKVWNAFTTLLPEYIDGTKGMGWLSTIQKETELNNTQFQSAIGALVMKGFFALTNGPAMTYLRWEGKEDLWEEEEEEEELEEEIEEEMEEELEEAVFFLSSYCPELDGPTDEMEGELVEDVPAIYEEVAPAIQYVPSSNHSLNVLMEAQFQHQMNQTGCSLQEAVEETHRQEQALQAHADSRGVSKMEVLMEQCQQALETLKANPSVEVEVERVEEKAVEGSIVEEVEAVEEKMEEVEKMEEKKNMFNYQNEDGQTLYSGEEGKSVYVSRGALIELDLPVMDLPRQSHYEVYPNCMNLLKMYHSTIMEDFQEVRAKEIEMLEQIAAIEAARKAAGLDVEDDVEDEEVAEISTTPVADKVEEVDQVAGVDEYIASVMVSAATDDRAFMTKKVQQMGSFLTLPMNEQVAGIQVALKDDSSYQWMLSKVLNGTYTYSTLNGKIVDAAITASKM